MPLRSKYFFLTSVLYGFFISSANAAAITNLTTEDKAFEIKTASGYEANTLLAGRTWRTPGKAWVRYDGREVLIEDFQEFAIWPKDEFGPQRHISTGPRTQQ